MRPATEMAEWNASWIWYPDACWVVDNHCFARKSFGVGGPVKTASCRVSACTDYKLFINGMLVGRGPLPSDPAFQSYDTYDVARHLRRGRNVIAISAYNYGIGTHWCHRHQAGLILQLDLETEDGKTTVVTDDTWRVRLADCFASNSPRQFWSAGFMETFDFHKYDDRWLASEFDDSRWAKPQVFGRHPVKPFLRLIPREIPPLREEFMPVTGAQRGRFAVQNVHAVRFDSILPPGQAGIVYAETWFEADADRELVLHIECDDAFKLLLNDELAVEKNYSQSFSRTRVWWAKDEYEQVHYGMGAAGQFQKVAMKKGWNRLFIAVDHGIQGWGFALAFLDSAGKPMPLKFAAQRQTSSRWALAGPTESTGFDDSVNNVPTDLAALAATNVVHYDPFDYAAVTDYATLMRYETRDAVTKVPHDAVTLRQGEFCILDLSVVRVGFPQLHINASADSILDIGYCQLAHAGHAIRFSNSGALKYVDRVYARPGIQEWQPWHRRTGRFIHVSCREGQVELSNAGIVTIGYPVNDVATFESSDPTLNRIWDVSRYTTKLLMQYGYQDCLKREQGTFNTSSFNYTSRAAACCFGDYALARRAFLLGSRLQNESGWFDSHGLSSPNNDEYTECLWWIVWLRDFYLFSGGLDFVRDLFDTVEDNLRYFAKAVNEHGLLDMRNFHIVRPGQITYLDDALTAGAEGYHGCFEGELSGLNIIYAAALTAAQDLARELHLDERVRLYNRKVERVKKSLRSRLWNPAINRFADYRKAHTLSNTGHPILQIAALYFGLCDDNQAVHLFNYLCDDMGLPDGSRHDYPLYTFGFYFYFIESLFRQDREDYAYELLRNIHGRWLELGATTFGEFIFPDRLVGKTALEEEYEVHAYGTSAHLHFYTNILGVRPTKPGFAEVLIAPRPGSLTWAKGQMHTPKGLIRVSWRAEGEMFILEVDLPDGCLYNVDLPRQFPRIRMTVNGKIDERVQQ